MGIVMGSDTATIPSLRQAPDVSGYFTLHYENSINYRADFIKIYSDNWAKQLLDETLCL